jgi:Ras-related GTP-binding protein A/B
MDLVAEEDRESVFLDRQKMILGLATSRFNFAVTFFKTSIWDETLYKAWSGIVYQLVPNVKALEEQLNSLCEICGANEVRRRAEGQTRGRD